MVCLWLFIPAGIHFCICGRDLTPFTKWKISTQLLNTVSFPLHFDNATSYSICPHIHAYVSGLKPINFNICMSVFSRVQLFVNPWTVACQTPLSMGLFRQEYWSGLPFPSPGDLPNPGIEPPSLACISCIGRWVLYHWAVGEALFFFLIYNCHQVNIANEDVGVPWYKNKLFFFGKKQPPFSSDDSFTTCTFSIYGWFSFSHLRVTLHSSCNIPPCEQTWFPQ